MHKNGSKIPLDIRVNPIETPTGAQAIASIVDFTEHQKLESTLREQVTQRDRFLATLTELRANATIKPVNVFNKSDVTMILVEDIEDSRTMLASLLELEGYQVLATAGEGSEGLEVIKRLRPAVALPDIGLPKIDGYQLARTLRAELGESIFLVALTGYGRGEDHEAVLEAGFDVHLVKPVNIETLNDVLEKAGCHEPRFGSS